VKKRALIATCKGGIEFTFENTMRDGGMVRNAEPRKGRAGLAGP